MASDNNTNEIMNALLGLPKEEIIRKYISSMTKMKEDMREQMAVKNSLIAELSQGREKTEQDRKKILAVARDEAASIVAKAHHDIEKAEETAQQKISSASVKADSIVESRLAAAQESIEKLEGERLDTKNNVLSFFDNLIAEYDEIIARAEIQLSDLKDSRQTIVEAKKTVNLEQFTRFAISDYVGVVSEAKQKAAEAVKDVTDSGPVAIPLSTEDTPVSEPEKSEKPKEPMMVGLRGSMNDAAPAEDSESFEQLANLFDDSDDAETAPEFVIGESEQSDSKTDSDDIELDFDSDFEDFADFDDFYSEDDEDDEESPQINIPDKQQSPGRSRWITS